MDSILEVMNWVIALRIQGPNKSITKSMKRGPVKRKNHDSQLQILFQWPQELVSLSFLEKEMATHSSILAWRTPGKEEPGGLLSMGSHRIGHNWSNLACMLALEKETNSWSLEQYPELGIVVFPFNRSSLHALCDALVWPLYSQCNYSVHNL